MDAWIDFAGDGNWSQTLDQILQSEPLLPGSQVLRFHVPGTAAVDVTTYARFRFSTAGGLSPTGSAGDGEVEDVRLVLGDAGPGLPGDRGPAHRKWSQPPVEIDPTLDPVDGLPIFCAWHEPARSTEAPGVKRQWRMVADDFHCLGHIPITRLRWWGTYQAWSDREPPAHGQPEAWHIGFWSHLEDGWTSEQLFPERLMGSVEVPAGRVSTHAAGLVTYPARPMESCFVHELTLEPQEWFHQSHFPARGDIFWISITAVYPTETEPMNLWGWLTRPQRWGRGAKMPAIFGDWPSSEERLFPGRTEPIVSQSPCDSDAVYDMAFELFTEQPWVKWNQPLMSLQQWPWVTDEVSQIHEPPGMDPTVLNEVADDWFYEGDTPVIAVSWQGSYLGYGYEACRCEDDGAPQRPTAFRLSILAHDNEQPGSVLWEVQARDYDEVLVGVDRHPEGEPNEAVFRYSVRLARKDWFQHAAPGQHLWFKVTAVYPNEPSQIAHTWGWTTRAHHVASPALQMHVTPEGRPWEPLTDPEAGPVDMAFTLYTSPPVPTPEGATPVAEYLRDTLLEGSFSGQALWMSPGPLDVAHHTIQDLSPGQGEVAWPAAEGRWWVIMLDAAPSSDWPRDVRWVFVREDLAMYRPWSSSYPPEIYNRHGEHVPLHCVPLTLEGLGMCRD